MAAISKAAGRTVRVLRLGGAMIMPLIFGWILGHAEPAAVFWFTSGFMTLSLLTFAGVKRVAASKSELPV